jgi:hypothetical protein
VGIDQYHQKRNYWLFCSDSLDVVIYELDALRIVSALVFHAAYTQLHNYVEVDINEWRQVYS